MSIQDNSLTEKEMLRVVNRYIGVNGGYLGDFSYRTHKDFYPEYCDLDIDPTPLEGTTRKRFTSILEAATCPNQASILRGVLVRFPVGGDFAPESRNQEMREEILALIQRLEGCSPVVVQNPERASIVVGRAISDAETLLKTSGATSAVDRIHTAIHGYLLCLCQEAGLKYADDASIVSLFKILRKDHPKLTQARDGVRGQDIERILMALANILDVLQPLRNRASLAHPNEQLLADAEAMFVVNVSRTILGYLADKMK